MTLMRIRQPHSYQEPTAEVIVTLCGSLRNHLHWETVSHLGQHWLFSMHQAEHNQQPLLHTSSIPHWGMHCSPQEGQVPGLYCSCNCQSPSHNHLYLSLQVSPSVILSGSELHQMIIKPAVTLGHQSSDAKSQYAVVMYKLTTNQP